MRIIRKKNPAVKAIASIGAVTSIDWFPFFRAILTTGGRCIIIISMGKVTMKNRTNLVLKFSLLAGLSLLLAIGPSRSAMTRAALLPCKINYMSDVSIEWNCRRLQKGETLESAFGHHWQDVARFNRIDRRHTYPGMYLKVPERLDDIRDYTPMPSHYQPAESESRFILVDLSEQFLGAYEYGQMVFSSPVATGNRENQTPTGEFRITAYSRKHESSLYQMEDTTKFYPMNYALRFHIDRDGVSYWFHGRDLPGYPASHGCIGLYDEDMQNEYYKNPIQPQLEDARKLFEWAIARLPDGDGLRPLEDGPKVLIIGTAPGSRPSSR